MSKWKVVIGGRTSAWPVSGLIYTEAQKEDILTQNKGVVYARGLAYNEARAKAKELRERNTGWDFVLEKE